MRTNSSGLPEDNTIDDVNGFFFNRGAVLEASRTALVCISLVLLVYKLLVESDMTH